jgi:hypothetical protein
VIALILEIIIATAIAAAVWSSGHPVWGIIAWFVVMSFGNVAAHQR